MQIPLQPEEREVLLQVVEQELDAAADVEAGFYSDRSIETMDEFLDVMNDHKRRTEMLLDLRERFSAA